VGRLSGIETVLLDLDGTLYVGSQVVPGAPEAVQWLREQGLTVRFCTNTDSIPPAALAHRLARRGFQTSEDELVTPVAVAARLLGSDPEARVLAVAADGVRQLLAGSLAGPGEPASHVLVADPATGRPTTTWTPPSGPCGPGRSWSPPRSTGSRSATTVSTWTPAAGCGCWSTPPARPPGC
jgi:hypothetical protein